MEEKNPLYTTVTVFDFKDISYINQLIALDIGIELALVEHDENDLDSLKKEITEFKCLINQCNIPLNKVRVHQPGGQAYYWSNENKLSGYRLLQRFFSYCYDLGFGMFVIHTPYGDAWIDLAIELNDYREKLSNLIPEAHVEVEEIAASHNELKNQQNIRFYNGTLFEKLMQGQKATMLLDTHECGGVKKTIQRLNYLTSKGFEVRSIHMQKDKHKFLTSDEVGSLVTSNFCGNLINEGFLREECSFDEFIKTKSLHCVVPNSQRIEILVLYIEEIKKNVCVSSKF